MQVEAGEVAGRGVKRVREAAGGHAEMVQYVKILEEIHGKDGGTCNRLQRWR